jgi:MFS family permease
MFTERQITGITPDDYTWAHACTLNVSSDTKLTYRYDRLRSISGGVIDSAASTFLLLIAVTVFNAGPTAKALIAAGSNIGMLLSLWVVPFAEWLSWPVMRTASLMMLAGCAAMLVAAAVPVLPIFVLASVVAMSAASGIIPLLTTVYQDNYPARERGYYVSRTLVIRVAAAAVFAEVAGRLLTANIDAFRLVLVAFALAFAFASFCLRRIPSKTLQHRPNAIDARAAPSSADPLPVDSLAVVPSTADQNKLHIVWSAFQSMRHLKTDRVLRWTLASWMLMGFANLMMWPLRVEYLANPAYGLNLNAQQIALFTITLPAIARLFVTPAWGRLFDRMNFFALRIILNVGFALGIAAFFTGDSALGLALGAIIFGVSNAGGEIAWSLWVTKIAPEERVAEYMSVHTFFTGVRGVIAPIISFQLIAHVSIDAVAMLCVALILLASLILAPEVRGVEKKS